MARNAASRGPVVILASREAGGSLLSALLGAHPAFCGAPHLNLLAFETVWQQAAYCAPPRDSGLHGLLRFVALQLAGEQTVQSIRAAERWLRRRSGRTAGEVWDELRAMVAPRRLVDYSPLVALSPAAIARALAAAPEAQVIHLTRDPRSQGAAAGRLAWQAVNASLDFYDRRGCHPPAMDVAEIGEQWVDWSVRPAVFDPQFAWARTQRAAAAALSALPADRWRRVRREALAADPQATLADLLLWLGEDASPRAVEAMLAAPPGPFSRPGPFTAAFGVDLEALGPPGPALASPPPPPRDAALAWRGDGEPLLDAVAGMAHQFGHLGADGT